MKTILFFLLFLVGPVLAQSSYTNKFPPLGYGVDVYASATKIVSSDVSGACANLRGTVTSYPGKGPSFSLTFPFKFCREDMYKNRNVCIADPPTNDDLALFSGPCDLSAGGGNDIFGVCRVENGVPKTAYSRQSRNAYDYATDTYSCNCPPNTSFDRSNGFCEEGSVVEITGIDTIKPTLSGTPNQATYTARVLASNSPQVSVSVSFTVDVTANSGGHDHHDANRPKGKISITQGTTDSNGEVKLIFTAPELAGIHTIKASCQNCTNSPASKDIQAKVPDLVELLADTKVPLSYTLVGQTTNHTSNHWFLPKSRDTLAIVVDTMFNTGWGAVGVNDGSLVWGGLFDIKGGWTPSHHEHRSGNEVDISVTNPRLASALQKKKTYAELCKKDNTAFSLQTLWHQDDGYPEHFHMYLDGTGLTSQAGGGPCCARYKTTRAKKDKNGNPVLDKGGNPVRETVALCEETSPR